MRPACVALLLALLQSACAPPEGLESLEGIQARYSVPRGRAPIPGLTEVILGFPRVESVAGGKAIWFQMEALAGQQRLFAVAMLVSGADFLYPSALPVTVHRYLLFPPEGGPIEYVDQATGKALVPKLEFFRNLLPHSVAVTDLDLPFFREGTYLGQPLHRTSMGPEYELLALDGARRLALDGEVLVGTSRSSRDDGSGRLYGPLATWSDLEKDYTYVELNEADYGQMMAAGFNTFRVPLGHLPWVMDEPVWFLVREGFAERPDLLYRSNFFGAVMYMDEPAIRAMGFDGMFRNFTSPPKAAAVVVELTRGRYQGYGGYGNRNLHRLLTAAGYDFGQLEIVQPGYPVWETVPSAAWYEMQAGLQGWCFEARYIPEWFADLIHDELGVDFPPEADACIQFHNALFTGASRRFGTRWGVAIYGQMGPQAAERLFPLAYERGATYFWFWTSDRAHHVPFAEQLQHARALRQYAAAHPRQASAAELTARARVAIALPYGYVFDHYQLKHFTEVDESFTTGRMWWSTEMETTDNNGHGATYGQVMAAAAREAAELLRAGTLFDFVFLNAGEAIEGYDQVRRVSESAEVTRD
ncbi:MAG: hypothetical protein ABIL09_06340 [Gemmatimonadota bacterium]